MSLAQRITHFPCHQGVKTVFFKPRPRQTSGSRLQSPRDSPYAKALNCSHWRFASFWRFDVRSTPKATESDLGSKKIVRKSKAIGAFWLNSQRSWEKSRHFRLRNLPFQVQVVDGFSLRSPPPRVASVPYRARTNPERTRSDPLRPAPTGRFRVSACVSSRKLLTFASVGETRSRAEHRRRVRRGEAECLEGEHLTGVQMEIHK